MDGTHNDFVATTCSRAGHSAVASLPLSDSYMLNGTASAIWSYKQMSSRLEGLRQTDAQRQNMCMRFAGFDAACGPRPAC